MTMNVTWPLINITLLLLNPFDFFKKCSSVLFQQYTKWHRLEACTTCLLHVWALNRKWEKFSSLKANMKPWWKWPPSISKCSKSTQAFCHYIQCVQAMHVGFRNYFASLIHSWHRSLFSPGVLVISYLYSYLFHHVMLRRRTYVCSGKHAPAQINYGSGFEWNLCLQRGSFCGFCEWNCNLCRLLNPPGFGGCPSHALYVFS